MKIKKMDDAWEVFKDNPWDSILTGTYPRGRLLYERDQRYWVSVNELGQLVFYIHTKCTETCDINIDVPSIDLALEDYKSGEKRLVCTLTDESKDLASKFVVVAKYIAVETGKYEGIALFNNVLKTILSWANFLRPTSGVLTNAELIGFWGECYVVSHMMTSHAIENVMRYWVGPDGAKKDITFNSMALEVKTTATSSAREISISSLDQLDKTTAKLYLMHLQITPSSKEAGLALNDLYLDLKNKSSANVAAFALFTLKTYEIVNKASEAQLAECFSLSSFSLYDICDEFPKITRENVPDAVVDAKYRLFVRNLDRFEVTAKTKEIIENG